MQVLIKKVNVDWVGEGRKKYGKAAVVHEKNGKEFTQYVMSFKNPEVFKKVQELEGQTVEVESVKDGDFWNWKSIASVGTTTPTNTGATGAASSTRVYGSNYETKEERAKRQVLIVRQSSLSAAVAILTPGAKAALDPQAVMDLAQKLTDWVFDEGEDKSGFDTLTDDIPY